MELSVQQVKKEFEIEFGSTIEDFLESAYLAGADLGGTKIESHARCIERSNQMLKLLNNAVDILRTRHKSGETYYWLEKKLGYTDATYTAAVDSGAYTNFAKDGAGYGLAQWTYHTRKAALLAFAKAAGKSVGDLETQLAYSTYTNCIYKELFGMNANQLREAFGIGKKDSLLDCFTQEELRAIQSMECLVSGLVDCGWEYDRVKAFIHENNARRHLAA